MENTLYKRACIDAAIWSALWMLYIYGLLKWFPWTMLHEMTEDIQKKAKLKKPTSKQRRNTFIYQVLSIIVIFGSLGYFGIAPFTESKVSFLTIFIYSFIICMAWNVIDLVIMDWFIVCYLTPSWVVIQGTQDCEGYKDYIHHFKDFLVGCVYMTLIAIVYSIVDYGILYYIIWK
ncbi:hypothetical protein H8356DRAFT_939789 [Neocallimastix lanati (nom. inval.)]|uniref:Uncharacterized protein n=1 Tax=Neocallimastix californiae TaxID=1754190 RepID=A0A1Y2CMX5_9FUNG|nr:hypothetical protein H8356DRAFT_939789 [Neocallimastix sp. JGI-2020a]ORY48380.1 hypothetical protein LY90DRAFT_508883 [Neocallimastix californiae]|eukprot:ORY48380.1 hypothetical protein LY90DRAFT_508883 [Neocallimastix californiae]